MAFGRRNTISAGKLGSPIIRIKLLVKNVVQSVRQHLFDAGSVKAGLGTRLGAILARELHDPDAQRTRFVCHTMYTMHHVPQTRE